MTLDRSLPFSIKADFSNSSWSDSGLAHRVGDTSQKSNPWAACIPAAFNHLGGHTHWIASFLFYFLLSNLDSFFSFACLTALTRTSSTVLNGSDKSRRPWFVPDLREKAFTVSLSGMMLTVGFFIDAIRQLKEVLFYSYFFEWFYNEKVHLLRWSCSFCPLFY